MIGHPEQAVILFSGGLDSTTALYIARKAGWVPLPLTFAYGQTHQFEVERAQVLTRALGIEEHLVLSLPFSTVGGSALLGEGEIPAESERGAGRGPIPPTYVPARNTVFLAMALAVAEPRGIRDIYLGVNALDYSGYPDCRPQFIEAFQRVANLATRAGVERSDPWFRLHTPLLHLTKAEIIQQGTTLGVDYSLTVSCYAPDDQGRACARCDACGLRRRGFAEAKLPDPTPYQGAR